MYKETEVNGVDEIEKLIGEEIEVIVIPECEGDLKNPAWHWFGKGMGSVLMDREEAISSLKGRSFRGGFGIESAPPMTAWSKNFVVYVHEYDGATGLMKLPRNPVNYVPEY
jgi:hypothetical protein